jgi:hypothetical protein
MTMNLLPAIDQDSFLFQFAANAHDGFSLFLLDCLRFSTQDFVAKRIVGMPAGLDVTRKALAFVRGKLALPKLTDDNRETLTALDARLVAALLTVQLSMDAGTAKEIFSADSATTPAEINVTLSVPAEAFRLELPARKTITRVERDEGGDIRQTIATETDA